MKRDILKAFLLLWLTYSAVTWVYTFSNVLKDGSITYIEPNTGILITELVIACLVAIGGLILLGITVWRIRNE